MSAVPAAGQCPQCRQALTGVLQGWGPIPELPRDFRCELQDVAFPGAGTLAGETIGASGCHCALPGEAACVSSIRRSGHRSLRALRTFCLRAVRYAGRWPSSLPELCRERTGIREGAGTRQQTSGLVGPCARSRMAAVAAILLYVAFLCRYRASCCFCRDLGVEEAG